MISKNFSKISAEIPENVCLVAVSKTQANALILEAYDIGQRHFGENKVQDLCDKVVILPKDIHWHMIGHLQTNKVKYIAGFVHLIHTVDSLKLLLEINNYSEEIKKRLEVLNNLDNHISKM